MIFPFGHHGSHTVKNSSHYPHIMQVLIECSFGTMEKSNFVKNVRLSLFKVLREGHFYIFTPGIILIRKLYRKYSIT